MALPLARPSRRRHDPMNPRKSDTLLIVMILYALYTLVPLVWLLFSSTKTQAGLFSSFGLWFADDFAFIDNLVATFSYRDGIFLRWLGNTLLYVGGGCRRSDAAGHHGGLRTREVPLPRAPCGVLRGPGRRGRSRHRPRGPDLPALQPGHSAPAARNGWRPCAGTRAPVR